MIKKVCHSELVEERHAFSIAVLRQAQDDNYFDRLRMAVFSS